MVANLYPAAAAVPTFQAVTTGAARGNRWFYSGAGQAVTHLAWYRESAAGPAPTNLYLWDAGNGDVLATVAPADTGAAGWQVTPLVTPIPVVANRLYACGASEPLNFRVSSHVPVTPETPLQFAGGVSGPPGAPPGQPTAPNPGLENAYSVRTADSGAAAPAAATADDVNAKLASWLISTGDNTHQVDGLPWLSKVVLDAIKTGVDNTPKAGDGTFTTLGKLWQIAGALTDAEIAAWNLFTRRATTQLTGSGSGGGSAFAGLSAENAQLLAAINAVAANQEPPIFPGGAWTKTAEVDFVHAKSWDETADLYTLSTSSWPANRPQVSVDGAPWRPRLGWWAVRNGDLLGDRRFVDWEGSYLIDQGRRMPGVVIWLEPDTAGHLEAWTLP